VKLREIAKPSILSMSLLSC